MAKTPIRPALCSKSSSLLTIKSSRRITCSSMVLYSANTTSTWLSPPSRTSTRPSSLTNKDALLSTWLRSWPQTLMRWRTRRATSPTWLLVAPTTQRPTDWHRARIFLKSAVTPTLALTPSHPVSFLEPRDIRTAPSQPVKLSARIHSTPLSTSLPARTSQISSTRLTWGVSTAAMTLVSLREWLTFPTLQSLYSKSLISSTRSCRRASALKASIPCQRKKSRSEETSQATGCLGNLTHGL